MGRRLYGDYAIFQGSRWLLGRSDTFSMINGLMAVLQYQTVNMNSGDVAYHTIDSLSAFWPGLQVLAGDVQSAIKLHLICWCLLQAPCVF